MSQIVETNKTIIKRYFEAYNTKNEAIFEIIAPDYIDHGQSAYKSYLSTLGICRTAERTPVVDDGSQV
jgi:hypothetical protein